MFFLNRTEEDIERICQLRDEDAPESKPDIEISARDFAALCFAFFMAVAPYVLIVGGGVFGLLLLFHFIFK